MNSQQAKALLANINTMRVSNRVKKTMTAYLQSIIARAEGQEVQAIVGRLSKVQQSNIRSTEQTIKTMNSQFIARAGDRLSSIPDSLFDNPDNELEANANE